MADYLLIESRDPFECNDVLYFYELAASLARERNKVTMFLIQNGVLPARRCSRSELLSTLNNAGVELLADDFSLRERGIATGRLAAEVRPASLEVVIERLAQGCKALWH